MSVTGKKTTKKSQGTKTIRLQTSTIPNNASPLDAAIKHFVEWNDPPESKQRLFTMLHFAFESDTADGMDKFERGSFFFLYRELCTLIDAAAMHNAQKQRDAM